MATLTTAGRIVFTIPFLVIGIMHFFDGPAMSQMVPLPGGIVWVYLAGVLQILASLAIITKFFAKYASLLLVFILLLYIVMIHIPGLNNPQLAQMAMISLVKDAGLMGGALILAGLFAYEDEFTHRERRNEVTAATPRPTV